jgi:hypothetical protein
MVGTGKIHKSAEDADDLSPALSDANGSFAGHMVSDFDKFGFLILLARDSSLERNVIVFEGRDGSRAAEQNGSIGQDETADPSSRPSGPACPSFSDPSLPQEVFTADEGEGSRTAILDALRREAGRL